MTLGKYFASSTIRIHLKWPAPIEKVDTPKVTEQKRIEMEFGQRAKTSSNGQYRTVEEEALMLTGDLNVAVVPWNDSSI